MADAWQILHLPREQLLSVSLVPHVGITFTPKRTRGNRLGDRLEHLVVAIEKFEPRDHPELPQSRVFRSRVQGKIRDEALDLRGIQLRVLTREGPAKNSAAEHPKEIHVPLGHQTLQSAASAKKIGQGKPAEFRI